MTANENRITMTQKKAKMDYTKINAQTIDSWIEDGWMWGKPISHEEFVRAKGGDYAVKLTPTKNVPKDWLGDLNGKVLVSTLSSKSKM